MKLCKDCKFFFRDTKLAGNIVFCHHPQSAKNDDLIYGNHTYHSCRTMRHEKGPCGTTGLLWLAAAEFTPKKYPSLPEYPKL